MLRYNKKGEPFLSLSSDQLKLMSIEGWRYHERAIPINSVLVDIVYGEAGKPDSLDICLSSEIFEPSYAISGTKTRRSKCGCTVKIKEKDVSEIISGFLNQDGENSAFFNGDYLEDGSIAATIFIYKIKFGYLYWGDDNLSELFSSVRVTYFLESKSDPRNIKVGVTSNLKQRIRSINSSEAKGIDKYKVVAVYTGDVEKKALKYLNGYAQRDARHVRKTEYFSLKGKRATASALDVALKISSGIRYGQS